MKNLIKFLLRPFLGKKILQPVFKFMYLAGLKGMNIGSGSTYSESGEEWALRHLAKDKKDFTLFDVGANQGQYALMADEVLGKLGLDYKIYSFEPSQKTFTMAAKNFAGHNRIAPNNFGLGEAEGELRLHYDAEGSGLASLYDREISGQGNILRQTEKVKISTVDGFSAANKIEKIDLLKLDVEGHELSVIKGAAQMIHLGRIGAIQFEFGGTALDARVYLKDFFILLSPRYKLYRILQNGLQYLEKYSEYEEIFLTTNYLAIRK